MGGLDGSRGYLVQSVIALLDSLGDGTWNTVLIEPDAASQKVDILWEGPKSKKAVQVKSSINQMGKADAERWATELRSEATGGEYALVLVGPCAESVVEMKSFQGVSIPRPKNLDINGLLSEAAHLLGKFLEGEGLDRHSSTQRELMVAALTTQLSSLSIRGTSLSRTDLVAKLKQWLGAMGTPTGPWEQVSFDRQRGIENAVAGQRLGPSDVDACPEFTICDDIVTELTRSHFYEVVGTPGCGKSITGWHVARRFHRLGFAVWRPKALAKPDELLGSIPRSQRTFLFVDDAHQFGKIFVDRLSESSGPDVKILLASTVQEASQASKICISPEHCVQELANALLPRRSELLPIVRQYDDRISDRYGDVSLEDRLYQARRESKPWEFFWFLRGGWQTARREFESLKQFQNAAEVLLLIAIGQIASCDAGVEHGWIIQNAERAGISRKDIEGAVVKLRELGLILGHDPIRTKHLSYAQRIIEECFARSCLESWDARRDLFLHSLLNDNWSLRGVAWAFDAIWQTDSFRWKSRADFSSMVEPLLQRCKLERDDFDWAAGLFVRLINRLETNEILTHRQRILDWATSRCGLVSYFCGDIINSLINRSNRDSDHTARDFIDGIDGERLAEVANTVTVNDLHTFGKLLDRTAFYVPRWAGRFLDKFDWNRVKQLILNADTERAFAVSEFVSGISLLARKDDRGGNLRFIEETMPYIVRAINAHPADAVEDMESIFWTCLGYAPKYFRGGWSPEADQIRVATEIVRGFNPQPFARAMEKAIPRDLEKLARSFQVIREIDRGFIARIAASLSEREFFATTRDGWTEQSSELQHLIPYFCLEANAEPAARWVRENRDHIAGTLCPLFVCIAPDLAVEYHKAGRAMNIIHHHWLRTSYAIKRLAGIDKNACVEIVDRHLPKLQEAVYTLSLDPATHLFHFFRVLFDVSPELFEKFVNMLSLDHPKALETIGLLLQNQHREREHYKKLANCGQRLTGQIAAISAELHRRLSPREF